MHDLWKILGYDKIALRVHKKFTRSSSIMLLQGPPGVGKSWLAEGIASLWQEEGGSAVIVVGDIARSDVQLYPFKSAMRSVDDRWKKTTSTMVDAAKAAETVFFGIPAILTPFIQLLSRLWANKKATKASLLAENEQAILYQLARISKDKPLLLVADNLHWWDKASLVFLRVLQDKRVQENFPFLAKVRFLCVQTPAPYQEVVNQADHRRVLEKIKLNPITLNHISKRKFRSVLVALGAKKKPSGTIADTIYSLSGGHLALASRAVERLNDEGESFFRSLLLESDFLQALISDRLLSLGERGQKALELLHAAALIGLNFRQEETICASNMEENLSAKIFRFCRDEKVIRETGDACYFSHDIYREFFLRGPAVEHAEIAQRLHDCLRLWRSGEYGLRSVIAVKAEKEYEAAALGILASLQNLREGVSWNTLTSEVLTVIHRNAMSAVVARFSIAWDHLRSYRHKECLIELDRFSNQLPRIVLAEIAYIRAMCLMSTRSESDRRMGRTILQAWEGYEEFEPELGTRLARLRLYGLSFLSDKEPGRALEQSLQQFLADRVKFDESASDSLYVLDRCSASLHPPDIAVGRAQKAFEYFEPEKHGQLPRKPVEYYRCAVNYSSLLIENALYKEAVSVFEQIDPFIESFTPSSFPRIDYYYNNKLLAMYRRGDLGASRALVKQDEIKAEYGFEADPFYIDNARATYRTLAGRFDEAISIWDHLESLALDRTETELNMVYLIGSNKGATYFLRGDTATALLEWERLEPIVKGIPLAFRPLLERKHSLLKEVFEKLGCIDPLEFDRYLVDHYPNEFGPLWRNFGRVFRMPAVEFWREN